MDISLRSVSNEDITDIALPAVHGEDDDEGAEGVQPLVASEGEALHSAPPVLDGDLVTLTLLPRSRWQTLLNLEIIQQRNKPKEPPKPPEKAPFFLPTLPGVEHRFAIEDKAAGQGKEKATRRLDQIHASTRSVFVTKLFAEDESGDREFRYARMQPKPAELAFQTKHSSRIQSRSCRPRWTSSCAL